MYLCLAQTKPTKCDIQRNIEDHKKFIALAVSNGADAIIFPELSLTGYEPTLAKDLATTPDDARFEELQQISDNRQITICVGIPTKADAGECISMVLFQPSQARQTYSKKYLHADEEPFFVSGANFPILNISKETAALAICYELSIPEHAEAAHQNGASIYIASVTKSAAGVAQASKRLSDIASTYAMTVLMANCVGPSDDFESAGETAVWNKQGSLIGPAGANEQKVTVSKGILGVCLPFLPMSSLISYFCGSICEN